MLTTEVIETSIVYDILKIGSSFFVDRDGVRLAARFPSHKAAVDRVHALIESRQRGEVFPDFMDGLDFEENQWIAAVNESSWRD